MRFCGRGAAGSGWRLQGSYGVGSQSPVLAALLLSGLLLSGCGTLFGWEEERPERIPIDEEAFEGESSPPLTSVPRERPETTSPEEWEELERDLAQDRTRASEALAAEEGAAEPVAIIQFDHASASLKPEDRRIIQEVARLYQERGGRLLVVGHASARTAQLEPAAHGNVNRAMSQRRAEAVAQVLREAGVPPEDLDLRAAGAQALIYEESMPSGEAGNRRAEIYLQE